VTAWTRALFDCRCGGCGAEVRRGGALLLVRFPGSWLMVTKLRCVGCEGPAPADLPPLIEPVPVPTTPMVRVRTVGATLPFDYKQRQIGDREVGEEG
jgi:hypothetical protein